MNELVRPRYNYWAQLGILVGLVAAGAVFGGFVSLLPLSGINMNGKMPDMDDIMKPENVTAVRWMQLISTFFTFFLPAVLFALIVGIRPVYYLGLKKRNSFVVYAIVIGLMLVAMFASGMLGELNKHIPVPENWEKAFQKAENAYHKQVEVIGTMKNPGDFVLSLVMLALLPAVFEEMLFRGCLQNLFARWFKHTWAAIIVTSIIFSAAHFSFYGFLPRMTLGIVLGFIFSKTGNLWLCMLAHFINNAIALTALYVSNQSNGKINLEKIENPAPFVAGAAAAVLLVVLMIRLHKEKIDTAGHGMMAPEKKAFNPFV